MVQARGHLVRNRNNDSYKNLHFQQTLTTSLTYGASGPSEVMTDYLRRRCVRADSGHETPHSCAIDRNAASVSSHPTSGQ